MNPRLRIKIISNNQKHVIEKLYYEKINLYDIKVLEKELLIVIDEKDLKKIKSLKTIKYKIIDYYGTTKIKVLWKKYKMLLLCIFIGIISNIFLSNIIFEIEVDTNNKKLEKELKEELNNLGLKRYHFILTRNKENKIKNKLLKNNEDKIEWIEIERSGTKYLVTVEEKKRVKEESCNIRNIVSKKNAMITKIESSSGEIIKKKYDYVEKGEVLISGNIYKKEDIVSSVCAKGRVLGEVWYKVTVSFPIKDTKIKKNNKYYLQLSLNNKKIPNKDLGNIREEFNIIKTNTAIYDIKLNIMDGSKKIVKKYSLNTIDKYALKEAEKDLLTKLSNESIVKSKKVLKKSIKNSKIIVEVFFTVEENITSYQDIINEEG